MFKKKYDISVYMKNPKYDYKQLKRISTKGLLNKKTIYSLQIDRYNTIFVEIKEM